MPIPSGRSPGATARALAATNAASNVPGGDNLAVRLGLQASPEHFAESQAIENRAAAGLISGATADELKGQNLMETRFSPAISAASAYPYQIGQEVFRDVRDQGISGLGSGFLRGAQAGWNNLRGMGAGLYNRFSPEDTAVPSASDQALFAQPMYPEDLPEYGPYRTEDALVKGVTWDDDTALRRALYDVSRERGAVDPLMDQLKLDLDRSMTPQQRAYLTSITGDDTPNVSAEHVDALIAMMGASGRLPTKGSVPSEYYTPAHQYAEDVWSAIANSVSQFIPGVNITKGVESRQEREKDWANIKQGQLLRERDVSPWDMLYGGQADPVLNRSDVPYNPFQEFMRRGGWGSYPPSAAADTLPAEQRLINQTWSGVGGDEIPETVYNMPVGVPSEDVSDVMPVVTEKDLEKRYKAPQVFFTDAGPMPTQEQIEQSVENLGELHRQTMQAGPMESQVSQALSDYAFGRDVQPELQAIAQLAEVDPTFDFKKYLDPTSQEVMDITSQVESFSAIQEADQQRMEREAVQERADNKRRADEAAARQEQVRADNQRRANEAKKAQDRARENRQAQEKQAAKAKAIAEKSKAADDRKSAARAQARADAAAQRERQATIQRQEDQRRKQATERAAAEKKKVDALLKKQMDDMMRNMRRAEQAKVKYRGSTLGMRAGLGGPR